MVTSTGLAALLAVSAALAQERPAKRSNGKAGGTASAAGVAHGKDVFAKKCSVCHYPESDAKKIGPGLKGISKRGTFTVNSNDKVTDDSLRMWIENGDSLMPPFRDTLDENQIKDLIAYVKTL